MQYDKKSGQVDQPILQTSKVVSLEEFRDRKNYQGGIVEYPCVDIVSYELVDFDGEKFTTIRFDDE
jgi:hypothetical protein